MDYSEAAQEEWVEKTNPGAPEIHTWNPGHGYEASGPIEFEKMQRTLEQKLALVELERLADMANRVSTVVAAYEDYADAVEREWASVYAEVEKADIRIDAVPKWWAEEVVIQRGLRAALVESVRTTANKVAEVYGVR